VSVSVTVGQSGQGFAGGQADSATMGSLRPAGSAAPAVQRLAATTALAAVTTDGSGSFTTSLTFNQVGVFVVTASGQAADGTSASASATITVLAAGGAGGGGGGGGGGTGGTGNGSGSGSGSGSGVGGLPNTGASVGLPLTVGAILVLLGAGLVTVFRRRRGNATA
jgi:LPXTG-motif cell wall-anchored protein